MEQIMLQLSLDAKNNECLERDSKKENIILDFHLAMVRDTYPEEKGEYPQKPKESEGSTEGNTEDECSVDDVLCKSRNPGMTWCTYTKQCKITSVEKGQVLIQSLGQRIICSQYFPRRRRACMNNSNYSKSEAMTIYYYRSNMEGLKGRPVVLNFSDSDRFLKCTYKNGKAVLTVECWEQDKLRSICKSDKTTWPFVFFLSTTKDNLGRFESAACSGWFIHTGSDMVYACTKLEDKVEENTFQIFNF